jgi:hypothetical protein
MNPSDGKGAMSDDGAYPPGSERVPMELPPGCVAQLTKWLEGHGFDAVVVRYRTDKNAFEIEMRPGTAECQTDQQAHQWLSRAVREMGGVEAEDVYAVAAKDVVGVIMLRPRPRI